MYPLSFETFVHSAITGWYKLNQQEQKKLGEAMRNWTYQQRGARAVVRSYFISFFTWH